MVMTIIFRILCPPFIEFSINLIRRMKTHFIYSTSTSDMNTFKFTFNSILFANVLSVYRIMLLYQLRDSVSI